MAGEYLSRYSTVEEIRNHLSDDWWYEPLKFYAGLKGSITELCDKLIDQYTIEVYIDILREMVRVAPYTEASIEDILGSVEEEMNYSRY